MQTTPAAPIRPATAFYWAGGALVVLSAVIAIVWFVVGLVGLINRIDDFQRVDVPGTATVFFSDPGGYTLYDESPGAGLQGAFLSPLTVSLVPAVGGEPVAFDAYDGELTYSFGDHSGRAVATFEIDAPGPYELTADSSVFGAGPVAVGRGIGGRLALAIAVPFIIGGLGVSAGAAVALVTGVRRSRAKRLAVAPHPYTDPEPPAHPIS